MDHNITLEGYGIRLRPVKIDDSEFIIKLRNMPHAIGNIGNSAKDLSTQNEWMRKYFQRDNDYYFIIESPSAVKLGTIGVYDIDFNALVAEPGRLVVIPKSLAALPSCILLIDFCFNDLKMQTLKGCIVSTNKKVIIFNQQLGYTITQIVPNEFFINNRETTMVHIELTKTKWEAQRDRKSVV